MRMVNRVAGAVPGASEWLRRQPGDRAPDIAPIPAERSLVAIAPARICARSIGVTEPPRAPFLAQLIAAAQHVPQLRARRRADPEEVIGAYAASYERRICYVLLLRMTA
jgi:hypothetical protein